MRRTRAAMRPTTSPSGAQMCLTSIVGSLRRKSRRLPPNWHEHGDALAIVPVLVAKKSDQITFLQCDADKNVGRRNEGEEQMARGHNRRRPEGDDEAEVDGVSRQLVEQWCLETRLQPRFPGKIQDDLLQPEQLEMVDQERAQKHDKPAEE